MTAGPPAPVCDVAAAPSCVCRCSCCSAAGPTGGEQACASWRWCSLTVTPAPRRQERQPQDSTCVCSPLWKCTSTGASASAGCVARNWRSAKDTVSRTRGISRRKMKLRSWAGASHQSEEPRMWTCTCRLPPAHSARTSSRRRRVYLKRRGGASAFRTCGLAHHSLAPHVPASHLVRVVLTPNR
jgi:hypothetical protein